ncbi:MULTISPECIES: polysaccharide pyruvyl transferase family protein [Lachnospiraceae]|uniref:Polysaccharide pyruvyl transferase n=1 Tax=Muricomes intestini TaxID=1796634 RepID=A0A4R3JZA5_9FIRM|nr:MULTISPECIES: polysaccharide pyruvyl transferase family protein [Lachnospiraceae]TCS74140.1 polysaccharide pyruvyl transferase [Muricomes intestini]
MIGIITFHGSHNHGSVLQAYATQQATNQLGFQSEIINFRMKSQKQYYALYQTKYGVMRFFRNLLLLPVHGARKKRYIKFEKFINTFYQLSGQELCTYEDLKSIDEKYDVYLAGSDQIWSNLIPEFKGSTIDYTDAYFLSFTSKKKVSYASSIGEISEEDLNKKKDLLRRFSYITTREAAGAEKLSAIVEHPVETVLDPTFLLTKQDWKRLESKKELVKGKYILLYTLKGIRPGIQWGKHLVLLGKKLGMKVVCVSPFFPIMYPGVENLINVGPCDFLNLISHAQLVFTDSFHGTAFSINYNKPFYSLNMHGSRDARKTGIISMVGLEERILTSFEQIEQIQEYNLDYSKSEIVLNEKRKESFSILKSMLQSECNVEKKE